MDPRIIRLASEGPQVGYLTQGYTRGYPPKDIRRIHDHAPWTVRWEEHQPSIITRDGNLRFSLPSEGDLLHATFLVLKIRGIRVPLPAGPNLLRDVTFRCDGNIVDRLEGEWVTIDHDMDREGDRHYGRDMLEYNVVGSELIVPDTEGDEIDIIIDLPFFFRNNASVSRGIPLYLLREDRHEINIRTRYPVRLPEDLSCSQASIYTEIGLSGEITEPLEVDGAWAQPDTTLPSSTAIKEDTWYGRVSLTGGIIKASMIFEVSDLPSRDRFGIRGYHGSILSSSIPSPAWELPVITRTFMEIPLQGRENHNVILPFQNELVGIVFALRPTFHQRAGRYTRFDNLSNEEVRAEDIDDSALDVLYEEITPSVAYPCRYIEMLESAELTVGSMVLERREALWWRQDSWLESGRTPPDRTRFVYGRFWDTDPRAPSGGTFLDKMPQTRLRIKLRQHSPDCTLLIWGLRRSTAKIHRNILHLTDLHA